MRSLQLGLVCCGAWLAASFAEAQYPAYSPYYGAPVTPYYVAQAPTPVVPTPAPPRGILPSPMMSSPSTMAVPPGMASPSTMGIPPGMAPGPTMAGPPGMAMPGAAPTEPFVPQVSPYAANPWTSVGGPSPMGGNPYLGGMMPQSGSIPGIESGDGSCSSCGPQGCGLGGGCDSCGMSACGGCGPRFFGSLAGLIMTRDNANMLQLAGTETNPNLFALTTRDQPYPWAGGFEARLGTRIGCSNALEMVYFMWDPLTTSTLVNATGGPPPIPLSTALCFCNTSASGTPLDAIFNSSGQQSFQRRDELHNLEINFLQNLVTPADWTIGFTALAGARWLRFHEGTSYGAAAAGTTFGQNAGTTSAFYDQSLINNFIGGQLGGRGYWNVTDNFRLFATPKVGFGAVTIDKHVVLRRGDGDPALDERSYKNDFGMLTQLDLGGSYSVNSAFSMFMAYRVVGVTGLALFEENIPIAFEFPEEVRTIHSNGSLLLHGVVAGAQFAY